MAEELKVSSFEEIAEKTKEVFDAECPDPDGHLVQLPKTGIVVRLRRLNRKGDILTGGLPLTLVAAAMDGGVKAEDITPEMIREGARGHILMRQTVVENCLEPRIGFDMAGRVSFLNASGFVVARVCEDDFKYMHAFITDQEDREAAHSFRNRKERRTAAARSDRKKLRVSTKRRGKNQRQAVSAGVRLSVPDRLK